MKATYTSPSLVVSGEFLVTTKSPNAASSSLDGQPFQKSNSFGNIGFGL